MTNVHDKRRSETHWACSAAEDTDCRMRSTPGEHHRTAAGEAGCKQTNISMLAFHWDYCQSSLHSPQFSYNDQLPQGMCILRITTPDHKSELKQM